jgi:hypothetical protein
MTDAPHSCELLEVHMAVAFTLQFTQAELRQNWV